MDCPGRELHRARDPPRGVVARERVCVHIIRRDTPVLRTTTVDLRPSSDDDRVSWLFRHMLYRIHNMCVKYGVKAPSRQRVTTLK